MLRWQLNAGDLISVLHLQLGHTVAALALDENGLSAPHLLDLGEARLELSAANCDTGPLLGWLSAVGLPAKSIQLAAAISGDGEMIVLQAKAACQLWLAHPATALDVVGGGTPSVVTSRAIARLTVAKKHYYFLRVSD